MTDVRCGRPVPNRRFGAGEGGSTRGHMLTVTDMTALGSPSVQYLAAEDGSFWK